MEGRGRDTRWESFVMERLEREGSWWRKKVEKSGEIEKGRGVGRHPREPPPPGAVWDGPPWQPRHQDNLRGK